MGVTLSPFRYFPAVRYAVHKFLDRPVAVIEKLKPKRAETIVAATETTQVQPSKHAESSAQGAAANAAKQLSTANPSAISKLMHDPALFTHGPENCAPENVVVLCHGLYGFSTATPIPLFPSLKLHYWQSVLEVLRDQMGVKVLVVGVKGTGSIQERAEQMHAFLKEKLPNGTGVNFVAHSMGGLDCRYLISHLKPTTYTPLSLTTIGTPHHGSPFMDWCAANIGVGSALELAKEAAKKAVLPPYSLKSPLLTRPASSSKAAASASASLFSTSFLATYLLNIFDSPAYSNLTTAYLRDHFNPTTPDSPHVKYTSVAGRVDKISVLHPLWFPKLVLDAAAETGYAEIEGFSGKEYQGNDGLVSVSSARWGEFLGTVDGAHHWELRGEGGLFPQVPTTDKDKSTAKLPTKAEDAAKAKNPEEESKTNWDLAQVGQVVDWVSDLLPGSDGKEVGKNQLRDAKIEKDTEGREPTQGKGNEIKQKFDLGRFYGGLMLKLKRDGF